MWFTSLSFYFCFNVLISTSNNNVGFELDLSQVIIKMIISSLLLILFNLIKKGQLFGLFINRYYVYIKIQKNLHSFLHWFLIHKKIEI